MFGRGEAGLCVQASHVIDISSLDHSAAHPASPLSSGIKLPIRATTRKSCQSWTEAWAGARRMSIKIYAIAVEMCLRTTSSSNVAITDESTVARYKHECSKSTSKGAPNGGVNSGLRRCE